MANHNATVLLTHTPTDERLHEIVEYVVNEYFPEKDYGYELTYDLPEDTPVDVADQFIAQMRDTPGSILLIVTPLD